MATETSSPIDERVEAYASWVRDLREGTSPQPLLTEASDPLARLGRELELLSAAVTRREHELHTLFDLVQTVDRGVLLDDVLSKIFEGFTGVIPFERIGCAFLSDDGRRLVAYWAKSQLGPIQIASGYAQPLAGSSLQLILRTGHPRIINDLEAYLREKPQSDATRRIVTEGGRSSLTCPLTVDSRPLGFLFFTSSQKHAYQETHQSIFRQIASQVAVVIDKSRVYEQLVAHNRSLVDHNRRLELEVATDVLTGVLNRSAIDAVLKRGWSDFSEHGRPCGVIMADIDHFKRINDSAGHSAGDLALQEFTRRLAGRLRRTDAIGRYGGEEFLIVVPDTTSTQLIDLTERLRTAVATRPFDTSGLTVTASFGAAQADASLSSAVELVQRADQAMYQAKADGRNRCVLAGPA